MPASVKNSMDSTLKRRPRASEHSVIPHSSRLRPRPRRRPLSGLPPPGRTLAIVAVLLVIVGAFVIPVIGPLVGLVWISFSAVWTRWEKIAAWLAPIVVSLTFVLVGAISGAVQQNAATEAVNPLLPLGNLGGWHVAILLPYFVLPIVGIVLLVKANNRGWRR